MNKSILNNGEGIEQNRQSPILGGLKAVLFRGQACVGPEDSDKVGLVRIPTVKGDIRESSFVGTPHFIQGALELDDFGELLGGEAYFIPEIPLEGSFCQVNLVPHVPDATQTLVLDYLVNGGLDSIIFLHHMGRKQCLSQVRHDLDLCR